MKSKAKEILILTTVLVTGIYFGVSGLISAKGFLAPIAVALLLAMILMPFCGFLEKRGFSRGWASFSGVVLALVFVLGLVFVLSLQVKQVVEDWPQIEQRLKPKIEDLQQWISDKTGMRPEEQNRILREKIPGGGKEQGGASAESHASSGTASGASEKTSSSGKTNILNTLGAGILSFFSFSGTFLLTLVYLFFMLLYRRKLRLSFLKFFPQDKRPQAASVAADSVKLSQDYLLGRLFLIFILAVLYSIGLMVSGVKHAILISVLAAFLSLLPYVGNIIGFVLAVAMAAFSGGSTGAFIGVAITFAIAQFVESYILEPYVVGGKVNLNPLMTIIVVVLAGTVWGVVGMVIGIPVFGILKIIFDRVRVLRPVGYMLGEEDIEFRDESFMDKIIKKIKS